MLSIHARQRGHSKSRNEEMGRKHILLNKMLTFCYCSHQVNVVRKLTSVQRLLRRSSIPHSLNQRGMQGIACCIMVSKLVLHFWQLVRFLKIRELLIPCMFQVSTRSHFNLRLLQFLASSGSYIYTYMQHYYLQKH